MALTPWQQSRARHDGGKAIANRKSTLARVASSLDKLIEDAGTAEQLAGLLTAQEVEVLRRARGLVARVANRMEEDVALARRIKAEWDARHKAATKALLGIPHEAPEDVIALGDLAGTLYPDRLPRDCVKWGWQNELRDLQRETLATLAHKAANGSADVADWVNALGAQVPAAKARHASLIAQVNALAVASKLQQAAA